MTLLQIELAKAHLKQLRDLNIFKAKYPTSQIEI